MPIPLPNLDDRQFADLVTEMRARIARYAPGWTNHNIADPGIMLLELFAWQTEALIYRVNRVQDSSRIRFLQTLGGLFKPAQPAILRFKLTASGLAEDWTLPRGTVLTTPLYAADEVLLFETLRDVTLPKEGANAFVTARQTALVENELLGTSDGSNYQRFELEQPFIVLPDTPPPVWPKVDVDGEPWTYKATLSESQPGDMHFTIKDWMNAVAFGDGTHGSVPPEGANIEVVYRHGPTLSSITTEKFTGNGERYQYYQLEEKFLAQDLKQPSVLEPKVMVNGEPWQYRARVTDMTAKALEFTVEPARNSIRFGNGVYGQAPPAGTELRVAYRYTQRPLRPNPLQSKFLLANTGSVDLVIEADQLITAGSDATDIDEAHMQAHDILKSQWRTISKNDFKKIVEDSDFGVARALCLPGRNVDAPGDGESSTGHVSIVVVPQARIKFELQSHELEQVLSFCPDGSCVVGLGNDNNGWLVLLEKQNKRINLGPFQEQALRKVAFSPSGESLITSGDNKVSTLRNTRSGLIFADFPAGAVVEFSPTGAYVTEIAESGEVNLWDARDATLIVQLSQIDPLKPVAFGAHDKLVASISAESGNFDVHLQESAGGMNEIRALTHASQVVAMVFTPDAQQLITAVADGDLYFWRIRRKRKPAKITHDQTIRDLIISRDGTRLVTYGDQEAWLWSTRSRRKMVDKPLGTGIQAVHFSTDSSWLAVIQRDGVIRLWDAKNGDEVDTFDHEATVHQLAFSPNSQRLVTLANEPDSQNSSNESDSQYSLRLWDLRTARDSFVPEEVVQELTAATLSQDGSWFCYADDNLLRLWSTDEKKQTSVLYHDHKYSGHVLEHVPITEVQGITHSKYLYTVNGSQNGESLTQTVHLWNAKHVSDVHNLVNERRLITSQHHVVGPTYTDVYIKANVARTHPPKTQEQLQRDATSALYEFFHPLRGGPDGQGWPWGRDVYSSEIYQILEGVAGVDHVESLSLHNESTDSDSEESVEQGGKTFISISPFHLVNFDVDSTEICCCQTGAGAASTSNPCQIEKSSLNQDGSNNGAE